MSRLPKATPLIETEWEQFHRPGSVTGHWKVRRYTVWWYTKGLSFIQVPNMLFTNSATPRINAEEGALLDAKNCRTMFCHSQWYKELIEKHKGPENKTPVITWPYPIDPMPGGLLPDEYDLLIYAKNGHHPVLLEHLTEVFPRHIQIHYGQHRREELYDAACRSRACAYLADNDHGPLALQEIPLSGCFVVGVRTGALFIEHGITGFFVDRLPPGQRCAMNANDESCLREFVESAYRAASVDRTDAREKASAQFATKSVRDRLAARLDYLRSVEYNITRGVSP